MTRTSLRDAASLLVFALVLALMFNVYRWLPDPDVLTLLAPPVEVLLALGALLFVAGRTVQSQQKRRTLVIATLCSALVLFGVGEGFYQAVFRQSFVPHTDLRFLPALLNMVFETLLFESLLLVILPVSLLVAAVAGLLFLLLRRLVARIRSSSRSAITLAASILLVLFLAQTIREVAAPAPSAPDDGSALPLTVRLVNQLLPPEVSPSFDAQERAPAESLAASEIEARDIHLFVVESYGHTLFSHPDHRRLIVPTYDRLEKELEEAGFIAYSGFLVSPAFGGRSWLADATMLSGVFLDSQHEFEQMMGSGRPNLTTELGEAGFHRVLAAPGTTRTGPTWRGFHEFDQYLISGDFQYRGPAISFGELPDQFLIHRANQFASAGSKPLFLMYMLVSSHVPFNRIPTYVPDWSTLGDGTIYNELPIRTFRNNWVFGAEYPQGYTTSIDYTLTSIVDFLGQVDGSPLVVIVGDHQPRIPVSEPEATFSVPVHFLSRRAATVAPFASYGFRRGFEPKPEIAARSDDHRRMDELRRMILDVVLELSRGSAGDGQRTPENDTE